VIRKRIRATYAKSEVAHICRNRNVSVSKVLQITKNKRIKIAPASEEMIVLSSLRTIEMKLFNYALAFRLR
jgi:hypothetical protein